MNLELKNKVALITGASQGIGLSIAEVLASEGVHVILTARTKETLDKEGSRLSSLFPVQVLAIPCDVSSPTDIERLALSVNLAFPDGIDILVNNAGGNTEESVFSATDERWQYEWDRHVMAVVRLTRKFAPAMANKRSGVIINNGSIYSKQANARTPVFCVTKSALMMLTKCLSMELINFNIRVNSVLPGPVWVEPHTRQYFESLADSQGNKHTWDQYAHASAQNLPLKRWATPSEIANFITFLCSPLASYCVGSNYYIDGGTVNIV